tara:strand:- start:454 stop:759 length:306 start_codon:yes stop_codon:yes gene_type:complete
MSKLAFVSQLSRTMGYLAFGLNNVLRFAGNVTQRVADKVSTKDRYNIEILVNGATMVEHKNQSSAQLSRLLTTMDNFGVTEVIITKDRKETYVSSDSDKKD